MKGASNLCSTPTKLSSHPHRCACSHRRSLGFELEDRYKKTKKIQKNPKKKNCGKMLDDACGLPATSLAPSSPDVSSDYGAAVESPHTPARGIGDDKHLVAGRRALCAPRRSVADEAPWCPAGMLDGVCMRPVAGVTAGTAGTAAAELLSGRLPSALPAPTCPAALRLDPRMPRTTPPPKFDRYPPIEISALDAAETLAASLVRSHPIVAIARKRNWGRRRRRRRAEGGLACGSSASPRGAKRFVPAPLFHTHGTR